jgi:hypothetical protein
VTRKWLTDVSAASWIEPRLNPFGQDTGSVIPTGFDAYARIFHPLRSHEGPERWADRAVRNRRVVHAEMQLHMISRPAGVPLHRTAYDPGPGYDGGSLPGAERRRLADLLRSHTTTPDRCWFCYWEGFGGVDDQGVPERVVLPQRRYLLARGALDEVIGSPIESPFDQSPNLWWPDDRAWIVVTEVDFAWTYVGGTRGIVDEVLSDGGLEALPAQLTDKPFYDSDLLNAALDGSG